MRQSSAARLGRKVKKSVGRKVEGNGVNKEGMKFYRIWALIERDLRKFFRSPALMMASMVFPLVQLIVLGLCVRRKDQRRDNGLRR